MPMRDTRTSGNAIRTARQVRHSRRDRALSSSASSLRVTSAAATTRRRTARGTGARVSQLPHRQLRRLRNRLPIGFAESLAILLTAGIPVDIKIDDFTSFFTQFPLDVLEQWLTTQLLSEEGADINLRVGGF